MQKAIFDYLLPSLSENSRVLEIGPGGGAFARECISRKLDYTGIEPSAGLREALEREGIHVVNQLVPPIDFEDNQFDLIHSFHIVEHMTNYHEVMQFFMESYRVLKPGGYFSVIAPNYRMIKHLFFQYEYQHSFVTTLDNVKNGLADCDFDILEAKCFLMWLSPILHKIDRLIAYACIPIGTNLLIETIIRSLTSSTFLFRVHKNLFDNIAIVAQKPLI
ncbi:MAG: class I SAM-dependent methyltransferase [Desulfobacteraceae bacterium]|nr:class I SAM-dependent methyltransferase [Desulfobacteraceae bacterium]